MTDDGVPFYAPNRVVPPRQPVPGELLEAFTVEKTGRSYRIELRGRGVHGVEAQILHEGDLLIARLWPTRERAIQWARAQRRSIEADGEARVETP